MRRWSCDPFIAASILLFAAVAGTAFAQNADQSNRYALVIGNANYDDLGRLKNPVNDATDMASALRSLGFNVDLLLDAEL